MKILIDARLYGLENAGLGRYLINLISSLEKLDNKNKYIILLRKKYFNELNFKSNFKKVLFDKSHYSFSEQFFLPLIIKKENPDLIHYPHFNIPMLSLRPFVVTIHDLLMHKQKGKGVTTLPMPIYFFKRLFYKFIFNIAVKRSKNIIVPSEYVKKEIVNYYHINGDKISVCYEGVNFENNSNKDTDDLVKKYKINSPYLLYVGNAYPHKNLNKAIQAILKVREKNKINFVIVSSRNIFVKRLNEYINKNNYSNFIKILNFIPDNKLSLLYKKSLGFLYPSISEGFGLQGLEAMVSKTPLIASNIEAFREIYKDNAIFFDPNNVNSIQISIEKLINLKDFERKQMIEKAYEFAKKYSWDKMADNTIKIYENSISLR